MKTKAAHYLGNKTFGIEECPVEALKPDEVRIEVAYCGVCGTDVHIYHGAMDRRVKIPQVIGHEASGRVIEVGADVSNVSIGDEVVVRPLDNRAEVPSDRGLSHICRGLKFVGIDSPGACQTLWTVPAFTVHHVPPGVSLDVAALAEPLAVACHDVRLSGLQKDQLAVVLGGGPIGLLVTLVARATGAQVLLSEVNEFRLEFARRLGIDVINPAAEDLMQACLERTDGVGADVVFEVSGSPAAVASMTECLALRGKVVIVAIHPQPLAVNLFHFFWKELSLQGARVYEAEDYEKALALMKQGELPLEQMISRIVPLDQIQSAFADLDAGQEAMKVLIDCRS